MPFYTYHCARCDSIEDAYRHVSERHNAPDCDECGSKEMKMVIVAPQVAPDLPGYESPVTGKWVEGRAGRREDLRRTGCRPYEGIKEERAEHARQQKYVEQKHDAARYETVARAFYALPEAKRRELSRG